MGPRRSPAAARGAGASLHETRSSSRTATKPYLTPAWNVFNYSSPCSYKRALLRRGRLPGQRDASCLARVPPTDDRFHIFDIQIWAAGRRTKPEPTSDIESLWISNARAVRRDTRIIRAGVLFCSSSPALSQLFQLEPYGTK
ncbi:hypothetical protein EVAR_63193_1 [Eumeta japonica]|uniref:Uncharacterized protein n=1 Tax=Eumeta variegata TaxID=151549 RepID=A0A4C1ZZX8_EUMVA|nr:hypothetical protein EVAR_63193_1 [Eumeta japonica]